MRGVRHRQQSIKIVKNNKILDRENPEGRNCYIAIK